METVTSINSVNGREEGRRGEGANSAHPLPSSTAALAFSSVLRHCLPPPTPTVLASSRPSPSSFLLPPPRPIHPSCPPPARFDHRQPALPSPLCCEHVCVYHHPLPTPTVLDSSCPSPSSSFLPSPRPILPSSPPPARSNHRRPTLPSPLCCDHIRIHRLPPPAPAALASSRPSPSSSFFLIPQHPILPSSPPSAQSDHRRKESERPCSHPSPSSPSSGGASLILSIAFLLPPTATPHPPLLPIPGPIRTSSALPPLFLRTRSHPSSFFALYRTSPPSSSSSHRPHPFLPPSLTRPFSSSSHRPAPFSPPPRPRPDLIIAGKRAGGRGRSRERGEG